MTVAVADGGSEGDDGSGEDGALVPTIALRTLTSGGPDGLECKVLRRAHPVRRRSAALRRRLGRHADSTARTHQRLDRRRPRSRALAGRLWVFMELLDLPRRATVLP